MSKCQLVMLLMSLTAMGAAWGQTPMPVTSDAGSITKLGSGWTVDSMYVATTAQPVNSNSPACPFVDYYMTDPASSDNAVHQATLLTAFLLNKQIQVTVMNCAQDRPKIIGVLILN